MCINVETRYKETEARMGDVTRVFIPEEGRKRRSNEVSYIIVAFYGTSSLSDVNKRTSINPPLSTF
ncbi:hypothetical protein WYG_4082 [Citrobacter sp. A1]|nr:hypothetical protein WYG_4082 [Citrobacter sp. A1]EKU34324.1 hypothetical protein B397_2479 [Citrobacter sp. L17]QGJ43294.1 hypothetical protein E4179_24675 [Citrobacter freundii]QGJ48610.1 hypothetical protein E4177_24560 [Citrobacter freundii]QGJ51365.1 hypothetical protein E4174_10855 [Citrobacter freundii]